MKRHRERADRIFGYLKVHERYDRRATGESLDHGQFRRVSNVRLHGYLRKQWRSYYRAKRVSIPRHHSSKRVLRSLDYSSFKVSREHVMNKKKTRLSVVC